LNQLVAKKEYHYDSFEPEYSTWKENFVLRLTQNFQLISPNGTLELEAFLGKPVKEEATMQKKPLFAMSFRDLYCFAATQNIPNPT
jgi:hypothetical protein